MRRVKLPMSISVPPDLREWFEQEAGARRMSLSDLAVDLITKGIRAQTVDETVARLQTAVEAGGMTREGLRQTLATRYLVEQLVRGASSTPATVGTDANAFADRELARIWPNAKKGDR